MQIGDDGSRTNYSMWYDSQLGVNCFSNGYTETVDGAFRCIPALLGSVDSDSNGLEYAAGCTQMLAHGYPSGYAALYVSSDSAGHQLTRFYAITGAYSGDGYRINPSTGACYLADYAVSLNHPYLVGAELPPDTFVKITEVTQ
jgi:hypothetical protein